MRRTFALCTLVLLAALGTTAAAQNSPATFLARVFLVDPSVNMKLVSGLTLVLTPIDGTPGNPITLKTDANGTLEASVPPGQYRLSTPDPTDWEGKKYSWQMNVTIGNIETAIELSNDNAKIGPA